MLDLTVTRLAAVLTALLTTTACTAVELWKGRDTEGRQAQLGYIAGTVAEQVQGDPWMVVWVAQIPCDGDWDEMVRVVRADGAAASEKDRGPERVDLRQRIAGKLSVPAHVVRRRPGRWFVRIAAGCYGVGAFADLNASYRHDDDEPAAPASADPARIFELRPGERREDLDIVIRTGARLELDPMSLTVSGLSARSHAEQELTSLDEVAVEGEVADLDEERFGAANGRLGYFQIFEFAWTVGPGIYFLEEYDPEKTPVLFVHGALGHPQEFAALIDSLDRTRFQPWLFFYPSGASLDGVAEFLSQSLMRLELRHGFDELAVVAHSMGGLVARAFILKHAKRMETNRVPLFVSISTPWAGAESARRGVERSPVVVPSWRDMASDSDFLRAIFFEDPETKKRRRQLPRDLTHHLLFGVEDETIALSSAVRWEAVRDAVERWPLAYDHTAILDSPEAALLLQEILDRTRF